MGVRGELFSTRVALQNRTYFFNVKENRLGDLYLNIVESKNKDEGGFERQSVILFAEDLQEFLRGFDESLHVLEKAVREKNRSPKKAGRGDDSPPRREQEEEPRSRQREEPWAQRKRPGVRETSRRTEGPNTTRPPRRRPESSAGRPRTNAGSDHRGSGPGKSSGYRNDDGPFKPNKRKVVVKKGKKK